MKLDSTHQIARHAKPRYNTFGYQALRARPRYSVILNINTSVCKAQAVASATLRRQVIFNDP
ncbi:hypothetical protein SK128_011515 [Halocaridina rubra]|uniref:Uncharacterized protein n=1 Tax=Halocaridina rubra TaxID=373956 RepID=A0AAN8X3C8_HALRR